MKVQLRIALKNNRYTVWIGFYNGVQLTQEEALKLAAKLSEMNQLIKMFEQGKIAESRLKFQNFVI